MRFRLSHLLTGLCACLPLAGAPVRKIPIEAFFGHVQIASPAVSPDGTHVAFLAPVADRMAVVVFDLATGKVTPVARAYDADIGQFFWKGNDRIVFTADPNGRESNVMIAVDLKGKTTVLAENYRENRTEAAVAEMIDPLPLDPNHVLAYGRTASGGSEFGLYRVNVRTAERTGVTGGDEDTSNWAADAEGHVRFRERHRGKETILEVRPAPSGPWKELTRYSGAYSAVFSPVTFVAVSGTGRVLYLLRESEDGTSGLYAYDLLSGEWGQPLFASDHPLGGVQLSWDSNRLEFINYGPESRETKWFDRRLEGIGRSLRATFHTQGDVDIVSRDQQEKVLVVFVHSDVNPGAYYLLDLRGRTQLVELGRVRPDLKPEELQAMKPIEYRARDGLLIHGYLTLPANAAGHRVPLILNPHGGPYGIHDVWRYNGEVQFLANRGYAVLQPNYRGSGGYGAAFLMAGQHEWGRKMQDNLTDAVKWAIAQGITDSDHVAIYGASYGGYAALAGATFTPDLYRCAVNYVGVSDLSLISNWLHEGNDEDMAYYHDMIGDDARFIHDYSPANFVSQIKIPLLNAYGENDPRVVIRNWYRLEAQLKRYGKIYEYIHEDNEGHGFRNVSARIEFYRRMEAFFAKYLAYN